jgi:hypothetical protein
MPLFKKDELDAVGLWRKPTAAAPPQSAMVIARANAARVLAALADWGALKTESVAAVCFPPTEYSQGLQLAQRKLKALAAAKLVVPRIDAHGTRSWVLTSAGGAMAGCRHGLDLSPGGATYSHHHLGARYLISKQVNEGYACYSEYAFTRDRCPFRTRDLLAALGKIPDGILLAGSGVKGVPHRLYALETEVAIKSDKKISKQLGMLAHLGEQIRSDLPYVFAGLIVLFPAEMEWHADRLARAARRRWQQIANPQDLADHVLIARAELGAAWAFKGVSETELLL